MNEKDKTVATHYLKDAGIKAGASEDWEKNTDHNVTAVGDFGRELLGEEYYDKAVRGEEPYHTFLQNMYDRLSLDSESTENNKKYQKERQERKDAMTSEQNDAEDANDTNSVLPADRAGKKDWMHQSEDDPDNWEYDDEDAGPAEDELHETSEQYELDTNDLNADDDDVENTSSTVSAEAAQSFIDSLSDQIADQGEDDATMQEIIKAIRPKFGV